MLVCVSLNGTKETENMGYVPIPNLSNVQNKLFKQNLLDWFVSQMFATIPNITHNNKQLWTGIL